MKKQTIWNIFVILVLTFIIFSNYIRDDSKIKVGNSNINFFEGPNKGLQSIWSQNSSLAYIKIVKGKTISVGEPEYCETYPHCNKLWFPLKSNEFLITVVNYSDVQNPEDFGGKG